MSAQTLIQKMRQQRQIRVELDDDGKKTITLLRPQDESVPTMARMSILEIVRKYGVDWAGITEADLLVGGGSEPVEWHVEIAVELLGDRVHWLQKIDAKLFEALKQRADQRAAALGN